MSLFENNNYDFEMIYQKALRLLDYSNQTEKTLFNKLIKKGYNKDIIRKVIERLKENQILNQDQYAEIYSENLAKIKLYGPSRIYIKLKEKGISDEKSRLIIDNLFKDGYEEYLAKKFLIKNEKAIKRLMDSGQKEKIKIKLYNNGFSREIINKMILDLDGIFK